MTSAPVEICRLLLRFGVGLIFLFDGLQKALPGTSATVLYFTQLGIPAPEVLGPFISYLELLGSILVMAGFMTPLVSALFVCEMVVAIVVARMPIAANADSVADAVVAIRLEALIAVAAACLVLLGGGRWSLDSAVRSWLRPGRSR
jgi:putative oxidoreductase